MEERKNKRWAMAQESERAYWEEAFRDEGAFRKVCLGYYPVYKAFLDKNGLKEFGSVLDCGSGPYSFLPFINAKFKFALDPLMDYFRTKVPEEFYKENIIEPDSGSGEKLPYFNGQFDLIGLINIIDHTEDPETIMEEANRCLNPGGYLLIAANHYSWPIVTYRNFLEMIGLGDVCHPKAYHLKDIKKIISLNGFKIIDQEIGDVKELKQKIVEIGGQTKVSLKARMSRAIKLRGIGYIIKQAIVTPGHFIFNKLFKTYPHSMFLCQKEYDLK